VNEGIRFYSVMAIHHENYVKDHVGVGNGAGFVISNIGSYYLANKFSKFYMKNIFPSRSVSANLLFVRVRLGLRFQKMRFKITILKCAI
jgi:hypothetical protein